MAELSRGGRRQGRRVAASRVCFARAAQTSPARGSCGSLVALWRTSTAGQRLWTSLAPQRAAGPAQTPVLSRLFSRRGSSLLLPIHGGVSSSTASTMQHHSLLILAVLLILCCVRVASFTPRFGNALSRPASSSSSSSSSRSSALKFKNFDEMLAEVEQPILVDFYAPWCGPCRMMQPVLEDIAGRMSETIKVAKVDTDRSPTLGNRYNVEALPTLILFSKGQVVERYVGYMSADELEKAVTATLKRVNMAL